MPRTKAAKPAIANEPMSGELGIKVKSLLDNLQQEEIVKLPGTRKLKVHKHLRTNGRNPTTSCPEIILRGNWLEEAGFNCDDQWVYVIAVDGMIIITPEKKKKRQPIPLK